MATFSSVTRQHVLQAIQEYDDRGQEAFLGVYGFTPARELPLVHEERLYDSRAILGVAHRYATGRVATAEEFRDGMDAAADLLRRRGFEVVGPAPDPAPERPARRAASTARAPRTTAPRTAAPKAPRRPVVEERPAPVCPTCFMTLPATGICDSCG